MSGYLPSSEQELQRLQPFSNDRGALPPESLLGGEKVIFEAHPRVLGLHPILFWAPIPFVVLLLAVVVWGAITQLNGLAVAVIAVVVFVLPLSVPTLYAISSARRTTYALTDQRVLTRAGDDYVSVTYDQVEGVATVPRSSKVVFALRSAPVTTGSSRRASKPKTLVWRAVRGAPAVAAYASSASRFYQMRLRQKQLRQDLVTAATDAKIVCQYCGSWIPLSSLAPDNPRCPKCSAPIVVAPLGI